MNEPGDVRSAIERVFRAEYGKVIATLIGTLRDFDLAEEALQDAFTVALERWPRDGIPPNPAAWLATTAKRKAIDTWRPERQRTDKYAALAQAGLTSAEDGDVDNQPAGGLIDDRLRLIFTCCHPALPLEARVALTLRTLAGLTTAEIARAFLTAEPTMAKRLVRAKQKIRNAGIPYRVPPAYLLPERTGGVLGVLYLLFNEGYAATAGPELLRHDLCAEAIRLARALADLMPDEPEAKALLALMLFHDSRRASRVDEAGDVVTLEDQDRSRWHQAEIAEGTGLLEAAARRGRRGPYLIQAAIAQCHATAQVAADTDWTLIAHLYDSLAQLIPSPVIELNRAVAVGMADGPAAGLRLVDNLAKSGALAGYYLLPATRADLLRRLGQHAEAAAGYREALDLAVNAAERRYLARRLTEAEQQGTSGLPPIAG